MTVVPAVATPAAPAARAPAARRAGWRARLVRGVRRRGAETTCRALIVVGWCVLAYDAVAALTDPAGGTHHMGAMTHDTDPGRWATTVPVTVVLPAVVMAVAMMGPVALPAIRHVAAGSLAWRRGRAVAVFAFVFVGSWATFDLLVMTGVDALDLRPDLLVLAAGLALAGGWQFTAPKRRALRDCHRTVPLPPYGRAARRADARFGLVHAAACVRSCWALMLLTELTPVGHVLAMAAVTGFVTVERRVERPRRLTRATGHVLLAAAAITAAGAVVARLVWS